MASEALGWKRRLLFTVAMSGIVFVCVEAMLQVYYYTTVGEFLFRRTTAPLFAADPLRGYRLKSNLDYVHRTNEFTTHIYTNELGLRTDASRQTVPKQKPNDEYRVMFLGPSFAFGWGSDYEDTYAARIAEGLRVPGKRVVLINVGTPAQGPGPQLCWFEAEGWQYRPDLVVQTSYGEAVASVLGECPAGIRHPFVEDGRIYSSDPTPLKHVVAAVKNFGVVFYGFYLYNAFAPADEKGEGEGEAKREVGKELYTDRAGRAAEGEELAQQYQRLEGLVKRLAGPEVEVAFLHIPLAFVVHEEDAPRWTHVTDTTPAMARVKVGEGMATLRRSGVTMVDTTEALTAEADRERMYYWLDIHLTPAGNKAVTDAVLPVLQRRVDAQRARAEPSAGPASPS